MTFELSHSTVLMTKFMPGMTESQGNYKYFTLSYFRLDEDSFNDWLWNFFGSFDSATVP